MGLHGAVRSLGFQIAIAMSLLIVAIGAMVVWQVDAILRDNEMARYTERLVRARDQLSQQLATDRELAVTGAAVLASDMAMREAIAERNVVRILQLASAYYQRTGTALAGSPGLQVYDATGALMLRAHSPLQGRQQTVPPEVTLALSTETSVGTLRQDEVLGLTISGVAPVLGEDGQVIGAIEALTGIDRTFILAQERLLGVQVSIFTPSEVLVSAPDRAARLAADAITPEQRERITEEGAAVIELDGARYLASLHTVRGLDESLVAAAYLGIEERAVLHGVNNVRTRAMESTLVGGAVAVVLASGVAFLAVRPIRELVHAARRIQSNDLDTPVALNGPREVLELAAALEDLRVAVRQTRDAMLSANRDLALRFDASAASLSEASKDLAVMHGILAALDGDAPGGLAGVTDELAGLDWVDGAAIVLATEEGRLSAAATTQLTPSAMAALLAVLEGGVRGQRLEAGIAVWDTTATPETQGMASAGIGGFVTQPMLEPDGVAGVVVVTTQTPLRLTPSRSELLRSVTLEVAAMLERTELAGEVEENRRIAESVLREMSDGVLVIDHTNTCRVVNPAAARILGQSRLQMVGQFAEDILPLGDEAVATLRRRALEPQGGPVAPLIADLHGRHLAISAGPFVDADPERAGMMVLIRDLSAEAEADRVKQDFVSMVGHELRTPLTLIRTTIDLLHEGDAGDLSATQRRIVEVLHANTDRLMVLINDLLDMSAIDSGRMQIQPAIVDVAEAVRAAVEDAQPAALAKQHQFTLAVPEAAPAWADRRRVVQVLANLLSNAIKYTPPGGTIQVSVRVDEPWVDVSVRDSGIGIPPEEQTHLFEKFYRTSQGRRTTGGTGLGLAIARSLVELHGGRIWCESDGHSGTTFTFTLPRWEI